MRQRTPPPVQKLMLLLMGLAFLLLAVWLIPELVGVFSSAVEDTFSEWVWDLPFNWVAGISILFFATGATMAWAAWHFYEGWRRRKDLPFDDQPNRDE